MLALQRMGNASETTVAPPRAPGEHVEYFDVLRCVAIVAVVMIHAAITEWHGISVDSARWEQLTWINGALRFAVPIFFMISGALFLNPDRPVSIRSLLRRRIPRLLLAYVVWSAGYAAIEVYGAGGSGDALEFLTRTVSGHFHLWFILALVGLNLGTPILRRVVADRTIAWYFVALAVPFAGVLPLLQDAPVLGDLIGDVIGTMRFDLVLGYSGYFVLGYLLHTTRLSVRARLGWAAAAVLGVVVTVLGSDGFSRRLGETDERYFDFTTLNVAVVAVAVFAAAKAWGDRYTLSPGWGQLVAIVGGASFGVYLAHPFFLKVLREFGLGTEIGPTFVTVPFLTLLALALSLAAAVLIRAIPRCRGVLA